MFQEHSDEALFRNGQDGKWKKENLSEEGRYKGSKVSKLADRSRPKPETVDNSGQCLDNAYPMDSRMATEW